VESLLLPVLSQHTTSIAIEPNHPSLPRYHRAGSSSPFTRVLYPPSHHPLSTYIDRPLNPPSRRRTSRDTFKEHSWPSSDFQINPLNLEESAALKRPRNIILYNGVEDDREAYGEHCPLCELCKFQGQIYLAVVIWLSNCSIDMELTYSIASNWSFAAANGTVWRETIYR
jgi:hypothetical protein